MDAAPFLAAIRAGPEDDGPRLVYADWLEDRGDPRGEFVRVQCELARLRPGDPRGPVLRAREAELLDRYRTGWLRPLGPLAVGAAFRRGFVDTVALTADHVRADLSVALAAEPIHRVQIDGCTDEALTRIAKHTSLAGLPGLALHGVIGAAGLAAVARSPYLSGLRDLEVSGTPLNPDAVGVVAAGFPDLTRLRLFRCRLLHSGAQVLAHTRGLTKLRVLDLGSNDIGNDGLVALARRVGLPALRELYVAYNGISEDGVRALLDANSSAGLTGLGLSGIFWGRNVAPTIQALANRPTLANLETLSLQAVPLGPAGAASLAESPYLSRLRRLLAPACRIGPDGARALAAGAILSSVEELDLSTNDFTDAGAVALSRSPYLTRLRELTVTSNRLTSAGRDALRQRFGLAVKP